MSNDGDTPETAADTAPPRRRRRWPRVLARIALLVVVLLVVARFVVFAMLPGILADAARERGLEAHYERLDVSLLTLDAELWNLVVDELGDGPPTPLLDVEYMRADVSVSDLLFGELVVPRVEIDGMAAYVTRHEDGSWTWTSSDEALFAGGSGDDEGSDTGDDDAADTEGDGRLSFAAPFSIRAVRIQHAELHIRDLASDTRRDVVTFADLRVSHVGPSERPTTISATLWSAPHVGIVRVRGQASATDDILVADLDVDVVDARPRTFAAELTSVGLQPLTDSLGLSLGLHADLERRASGSFAGHLGIGEFELTADDETVFELGALDVPVVELAAGVLELGEVVVSAVEVRSFSDAAGRPVLAGLRLVPTAPTSDDEEEEEDAPSSIAFALAGLTLEDLDVRHDLLASTPVTSLAVLVDALHVGPLRLPADASTPHVDLDLAASLPGLVGSLTLDGSASPTAATGDAALTLRADAVTLDALEPLLHEAGLVSTLDDATITVDIGARWDSDDDGRVGYDMDVERLGFETADGARLLGFDSLRVGGFSPPTGVDERLTIDVVDLDGLGARVRREDDGSWRAFGIAPRDDTAAASDDPTRRTLSRVERRALSEPAPEPPRGDVTGAETAPPAPIAVGRIDVDASALVLDDALRDRVVTVARLAAGVDGLRVTDGVPHIDTVTLDVTASHALDSLSLDLELTEDGDRTGLEGSLSASGLSLVDVADDLGLDGVWLDDGSLHTRLSTSWRAADDGLEIDGRVDEFALRQDDRDLLAFESLVLGDAAFGDTTRIDELAWTSPRVALTRRDDGRLEFAGLTFGGNDDDDDDDDGDGDAVLDDTTPITELVELDADDTSPSDGGHIGSVAIRDAGIDWTDPTGSSRIDLSVTATDLGWGRLAGPADLALTVAVPAALDEFAIEGVVDTTPDRLDLELTLRGRGMRAGPLARYLPPDVALTWDDARFDARLEALWAHHPDGGHRAQLAVDDLRLADPGQEYLSLPELRIDAPRIDPTARRYDVDAVTMRGLRTFADRRADGDVEVLGVLLAGRPPDDDTRDDGAAVVDGSGDVESAPDGLYHDVDADARQLVRDALRERLFDRASLDAPIHVDIDSLDLHVERAEFGDETAPEPYVVHDLRIRSTEPISLPERPVELVVDATVDPFVERLTVTTHLDARALPASLDIDLDADGVRTPGSDSTRAARARIDIDWESARGAPFQYDPNRGLFVDARITDVALSETPGGPADLGFEQLAIDGLRFVPDRGLLDVDTVLLQRPIGDVRRDARGVTIGGLRLPADDGAEGDDDDGIVVDDVEIEPEPTGLAVRIGTVIVTGIDASYEDVTTEPRTFFPLEDLDLEVRSIDVDRLPYGHAMPFTLFVRGGTVPAATLGHDGDDPVRVLSGLEVDGKLAIAPALDGFITADVYGLELSALSGLASKQGITLRDGTFDLDARYTLRADKGLEARNHLVFTHLAASEPSGGLLSKMLLLTVPLRAVIAVLRDEAGVIDLDVNFATGADGIALTEIARVAGTTLAMEVAQAIANSPFRVLGLGADVAGQVSNVTGLTSVFESTTRLMGVGDIDEDVPVKLELSFPPGVVEPLGSFEATIATWSELMAEDRSLVITLTHQLGTADVARMERRLHPPADVILQNVEHLRGRRATLLSERDGLLDRARAVHAVSPSPQSDPVIVRLGRVNEQLGDVERSLDATLELLGPAAERRSELRVGKGCIALGQARLDALKRRILANEVVRSKLVQLIDRRTEGRAWERRVRTQRPRFEPHEDLTSSRVIVALQRHER